LTANFNIRKVLVAPLDWGLGHATRCIPLIRALLAEGLEVRYAAEGAQAALLQQEFPSLVCLPLKGYRVTYTRKQWWFPVKMLLQLPRLFATVRKEHAWLDQTITDQGIDLVISDNRYGLWSKKVPTVFITHQLTIKAPNDRIQNWLQRNSYRYINRFHTCWVPDAPGEKNAAGILSHPQTLPSIPVRWIGLLARFEPKPSAIVYDYCIALSGPEPQRTMLEQKILKAAGKLPGKILLVRGKPGTAETIEAPANMVVKNHLDTGAMQEAILQSEYIVSRSGYTTIMELIALKKKMILIPTPGQTEQEYLAERLMRTNAAFVVSQESFDVVRHLEIAKTFHYQIGDLPVFETGDMAMLLKKL
jgi:UDP:flavonoid glycosyltransferase YjiC (YdhE family)